MWTKNIDLLKWCQILIGQTLYLVRKFWFISFSQAEDNCTQQTAFQKWDENDRLLEKKLVDWFAIFQWSLLYGKR